MSEFKEMLNQFVKIPKTKVCPPTFMEISGYPHFENVCSNILAFFFDTKEHHHYKDFFIRTLLECLEKDLPEMEMETIKVLREVVTHTGKRIDILIETECMVIAIENKIWADLYNDLNDYANFLQDKYSEKTIIKLVLSIDPVSKAKLSEDFICLTYSEFLDKLERGIGKQLGTCNPAYLFHLTDFIKTIHNHTKLKIMNTEMLKFFIEEREVVNRLIGERDNMTKIIYDDILKDVQRKTLFERNNTKQWVWQKFDLVHDITLDCGVEVAVNCWFKFEGIEICVGVRKGLQNKNKKIEFLKSLDIYSDDSILDGERIVVISHYDMPLDTPTYIIAEKLTEVVGKIKRKVNVMDASFDQLLI